MNVEEEGSQDITEVVDGEEGVLGDGARVHGAADACTQVQGLRGGREVEVPT